jgi:hypothetical protein
MIAVPATTKTKEQQVRDPTTKPWPQNPGVYAGGGVGWVWVGGGGGQGRLTGAHPARGARDHIPGARHRAVGAARTPTHTNDRALPRTYVWNRVQTGQRAAQHHKTRHQAREEHAGGGPGANRVPQAGEVVLVQRGAGEARLHHLVGAHAHTGKEGGPREGGGGKHDTVTTAHRLSPAVAAHPAGAGTLCGLQTTSRGPRTGTPRTTNASRHHCVLPTLTPSNMAPRTSRPLYRPTPTKVARAAARATSQALSLQGRCASVSRRPPRPGCACRTHRTSHSLDNLCTGKRKCVHSAAQARATTNVVDGRGGQELVARGPGAGGRGVGVGSGWLNGTLAGSE